MKTIVNALTNFSIFCKARGVGPIEILTLLGALGEELEGQKERLFVNDKVTERNAFSFFKQDKDFALKELVRVGGNDRSTLITNLLNDYADAFVVDFLPLEKIKYPNLDELKKSMRFETLTQSLEVEKLVNARDPFRWLYFYEETLYWHLRSAAIHMAHSDDIDAYKDLCTVCDGFEPGVSGSMYAASIPCSIHADGLLHEFAIYGSNDCIQHTLVDNDYIQLGGWLNNEGKDVISTLCFENNIAQIEAIHNNVVARYDKTAWVKLFGKRLGTVISGVTDRLHTWHHDEARASEEAWSSLTKLVELGSSWSEQYRIRRFKNEDGSIEEVYGDVLELLAREELYGVLGRFVSSSEHKDLQKIIDSFSPDIKKKIVRL